jgi:hypothetical protein
VERQRQMNDISVDEEISSEVGHVADLVLLTVRNEDSPPHIPATVLLGADIARERDEATTTHSSSNIFNVTSFF